jgi:hypothetical protein
MAKSLSISLLRKGEARDWRKGGWTPFFNGVEGKGHEMVEKEKERRIDGDYYLAEEAIRKLL